MSATVTDIQLSDTTHAIGYEAATLLYEAVAGIRYELAVDDIAGTIQAHPTLSKVVKAAVRSVDL